MERVKAEAVIEAILFTMGESVEGNRLADVIEEDLKTTKEIIKELSDKYENENRGIAIIELDGAYQMCTNRITSYNVCYTKLLRTNRFRKRI